MMKTTRSAKTRKTGRAPESIGDLLFGLQPERQTVDARDLAALALAERLRVTVARVPRRAAQLGLADRAGRKVVEQDGDLPDERVDALRDVLARSDPAHEPAAQRDQEHEGDQREEEPLHRRGLDHAEPHDEPDDDRTEAEEHEEERAGRDDLASEETEPEERPEPPRHRRVILRRLARVNSERGGARVAEAPSWLPRMHGRRRRPRARGGRFDRRARRGPGRRASRVS